DGLDLSAFAGIELTAHNPGLHAVVANLRVENRPNARAQELGQNPWNTEKLVIKPGETVPLRLTFGQNNGSPGYDLHAGRVSAIQLFLIKPMPDSTLVLSDLKAWGSAGDRAASTVLTKPADRTLPVTPPAWLGQRPPVEGNWVQTLDENFDGEKLNDKLWTPSFPWDGLQPGQLQRYSAENVTVTGGHARFKAEKRRGHHNDDPARPARDYTSGIIQSYDKWTQLYGYMESRIKLPTTRGLWPAFWMMPDRGAASGLDLWKRRSTSKGAMEIDIMEHLCEWGPGRHNAAVHWDDYGDNHKAWGSSIFYGPTPDGWHVFGVLWEPGKLTWFIDGKKAAEWENERVSTVPGYLKLNIQIGGWATKNVDDASLPDYMTVDYVRAWQLRERQK
ncbi:MAG TPA: glycoside hydrolase family 16 protein, partial [Rariglobus sp.]|nr:glycoside hydrolase family 16 protein [Rariglobus sp.]